MGFFRRNKPVTATVRDQQIRCLICAADQFWEREVKVNTTGMELLGAEWANESALGLVCVACGYVHEFLGDAVQMWETK